MTSSASKHSFHSRQPQNGQPYLNCEGSPTLPGCGVTEWSQASYGPTFDATGGGVFAMKWDQDGISVCEPVDVLVPKVLLNSSLPKGISIVSPCPRISRRDSPILPRGQSRLPPWNPQVAIHCSTSRTTRSYSVSSFSSHGPIRGIDVDEDITFCGPHIIPCSNTHLN